jgi:hypothetical protein
MRVRRTRRVLAFPIKMQKLSWISGGFFNAKDPRLGRTEGMLKL